MGKSDERIKEELDAIDNENIEQAIYLLRNHGKDVSSYLASFVAAICDVSVEDMLSEKITFHIAHARWLYYYAYRYMTNESFTKISIQTKTDKKTYSAKAIQNCVTKMSMMIANEPLWSKRWSVIKRVIKLQQEDRKITNHDNTIIINIPKELKEHIKIEIKEK